jgi:adenylate cyclase
VKTPGDAILAVFWQDVRGRNHATCALRSGEEILRDLPTMRRTWEAAGVTLDIGIGIDAGQVAMGLVGKLHLEPTVIGDAVNVAQRLEGLTKDLKRPLIFSESVRERLQEEVDAVSLGQVTVRGRATPLSVYGLGGPGDLAPGPEQSTDLAGKEKTE